jgi:hypothetical protein
MDLGMLMDGMGAGFYRGDDDDYGDGIDEDTFNSIVDVIWRGGVRLGGLNLIVICVRDSHCEVLVVCRRPRRRQRRRWWWWWPRRRLLVAPR